MKIRWIVTIAAAACLLMSGCGQELAKEGATMNVSKAEFGKMPDGTVADLYTLTNGKMTVKVTNYGGIITSILTPDRTGKTADVALGFDEFSGYLGSHPFFGAIAGRYANRIAKGKFTLNGKEYTLAANNGVNHLYRQAKRDLARLGLELSLRDRKGLYAAVRQAALEPGPRGFELPIGHFVNSALGRNVDAFLKYQLTPIDK